jgi:hypothetical protein
MKPEDFLTTDAAENLRLTGIIMEALQAMGEGRYGDCRRILRTGRAPVLKAVTSVKEKIVE